VTDSYLLGVMCDGACGALACPKCEGALPFGVGNAIEIKVILRSPYKREPEEKWLPATITSIDDAQICVAFSDGERLAVPRHSSEWRSP
jgi:hypothetical protein